MKKFILIVLLPLLSGCDIQKQATKAKTETDINQDYEKREYRPSEPVIFDTSMFKGARDTTIVVVNSEGSKIRVQLDDKGNVSNAECLPYLMEIITKMSTQFQQSEKIKEKEKTEEFNTTWVLYIAGAIVLIFFVAIVYLFITMSRNTAILSKIVNK